MTGSYSQCCDAYADDHAAVRVCGGGIGGGDVI